MSTLSSQPSPARAQKSRGQSLVEVSLFLPLLLIMLSGLVEFGFALNQYLNALDAAREAARYSSDGDPDIRAFCGDGDNDDLLDDEGQVASVANDDGCPTGPPQYGAYRDDEILDIDPSSTISIYKGTADFYAQAAFIALQTIKPLPLNPARDDIVISVFRVLSGTVVGRWPDCEPDGAEDCPSDPPTYTETYGEWHLFGYGASEACVNGKDDDNDGVPDDGCPGGPATVGLTVDWDCERDPITPPLCHPSRITTEDVTEVLQRHVDAPNSAVIAVEVFYSYDHILKLPWITPFVPDPIEMHTFTIAPVPAAEPSLTISGTITETFADPDVVLGGVTVEFILGGVSIGQAITDVSGRYVKGGLNSGSYTLIASRAGSTCTFVTLFTNPVVLTTADAPDKDFTASCPPPTPVPPPTITHTPTSTPTETSTPSESPTPTATPEPTSTPVCPDPDLPVDPGFSDFDVVTSSVDADGVEISDLVVTVRSYCGVMASQPVTITSSRGGVDVITPATGFSDPTTGQFFATIKSALSSPEDDTNGTPITPTTLTAQAGAGTFFATIVQQPTVQFLCANGIKAGFGASNDIQYFFVNDTAEERSLNKVTLSPWPAGSGREMNTIIVYSPTFTAWTGGESSLPAIVGSGWLGTPTDRSILASGGSLFLQILFNIDLTTIPGSPDNPYVIQTEWKNEADGRVCISDSISILR